MTLEQQGDACYTAIIEDSVGRIHLVYSYAAAANQPRELKHVIVQIN
jgi:hypothetical protein